VAVAALRDPPAAAALRLLCERAVASGGVSAISLVAFEQDEALVVAGAPLAAPELEQAERAYLTGTDSGASLHNGRLKFIRTFPAGPRVAYLLVAGGVAVLELREAALLGLAGLLLDRRRSASEAERVRSLEASDRLKAAILSSISHELKSPLTSLRAGLTTLLMPEARLAPEQRELASGMDRQATRLDRLVGDLLTMSKLEAGLPIERSPQEFPELVGAALSAVRPALTGFDLQVRLAPDLPPVLADELQIERVLTNLLENASEWTRPGGRILLGASADGQTLSAWVENQGPEIAGADLDEVFDKFWTRREGGSGLGLAICRRVVEAHGGQIRVENTGGGPRFTFTLPLATEQVAAG
jgi:two-component system sensor histidine kinase KdpD